MMSGEGEGTGVGAGTWTPPEGIPAEFVGSSADETLAKLLPAYTETHSRAEGLRTKVAQMPTRPDTSDAYTFDPGDKLKPWFGDLNSDPIWGHTRKAAHEAGLSQDQLQKFVSGVYGPMVDEGLLATPYDPATELKTFMSESGLDQNGVEQALLNNEAFAKGLSSQLKGVSENMKPEIQALLVSLSDTAAGNVLLRALSGRLAENGIRISGESGGNGVLTAEDVKKLHTDPRIDPRNRNHSDPDKRFDEDLRKRYDEACNRA